jgi:hypothetical protein
MAGYKNTFWLGGNLVFDLKTGKMTEVLQLVYREEDATTFMGQFAENVFNFVKMRTDEASLRIRWFKEKSKTRPNLLVIKGEQDV